METINNIGQDIYTENLKKENNLKAIYFHIEDTQENKSNIEQYKNKETIFIKDCDHNLSHLKSENDFNSNNIFLKNLNTIQDNFKLHAKDLIPPDYHNNNNNNNNSNFQNNHYFPKDNKSNFSKSMLIDWKINDIRSLLIFPEIKPEWCGVIPDVIEDGFNISILPLKSSNDYFILHLASSNIYKEHNLPYEFHLRTGLNAVHEARKLQYYRLYNTFNYIPKYSCGCFITNMSSIISESKLSLLDTKNILKLENEFCHQTRFSSVNNDKVYFDNKSFKNENEKENENENENNNLTISHQENMKVSLYHFLYHEQDYPPFTISEWRNMIENYVLNLACEAQCRVNYKLALEEHKYAKKRQLVYKKFYSLHSSTNLKNKNGKKYLMENNLQKAFMIAECAAYDIASQSTAKAANYGGDSLLRRVLKRAALRSNQIRNSFEMYLDTDIELSSEEKELIWKNVQLSLYYQLGINWNSDNDFGDDNT